MGVITAIPSKGVAIELLGQDHWRPAEVCAVIVDCLAKGQLFFTK